MNLLLINVGNSDLLADGNRPSPARMEGKELWERYDEHTFSLPIIEPCLRFVLRQTPGIIERIVLFDTDQQPTGAALQKDRNGVALRDKDTIWFGRIIERCISERYADRIGTIERRDLSGFNPSLYDEAFEAYGRELTELYDSGVQTCWVLMSGGIPACNNALHLQAISRFGERCRTIYQPEGGAPYGLRTGAQVLRAFRDAIAIDALQRLDFSAALLALDGSGQEALLALLRYAQARESFDFDRSQAELELGIAAASGDMRQFMLGLRRDLEELADAKRSDLLLWELVVSAGICYRNARYADFLGRAFRFQEATLRHIIESVYQLSTDMSNAKRAANQPLWEKGIESNSDLKAYLEAIVIGDRPFDFSQPTIPVLTAMVSYLVDDKHGRRADGTGYLEARIRPLYKEVAKRLGKIKNLSDLRNQSIVAHGFRGVSREAIAAAYGGGDPLEDMRKCVELLGIRGQERLAEIAVIAVEHVRRGG